MRHSSRLTWTTILLTALLATGCSDDESGEGEGEGEGEC